MKNDKIFYWISTGMMCLVFLFSATMYFTKYEMVQGFFKTLGYPTYIIYPLAILKILGVIAILTRKSKILTEWAYAGFFFDAVLALVAHINLGEGGYSMSAAAIVFIVISRFYYGRLFINSTDNA